MATASAAVIWLALLAAVARAEPPQNVEPFLVGIGRSIHDKNDGVADALRFLGVRSIRVDAPWQSIEQAPGRYAIPAWLDAAVDSARAAGAEPLLILAYGNALYGGDKPRSPAAIAGFLRYARYVTLHFAGRVRYFDLWNEWDAQTGRTTPGSADDYVALARHVYPAIKATNPDAVVLSGGISSSGLERGWVERFIELGGLEVVDALSLHPYNLHRDGSPEEAIAELDRVHALTRNAARPVPIYVTEMGYPAYSGRGGVSRETAAVYLARFMLLASTRPYIAGVWWYCLRDQGNDPANREHTFGVLDSALQPKRAAHALRDVAALLAQVQRFRDRSRGSEQRVVGSRADGGEVVLAWNAAGADVRLLSDLEPR
jgi:hypothetical protein